MLLYGEKRRRIAIFQTDSRAAAHIARSGIQSDEPGRTAILDHDHPPAHASRVQGEPMLVQRPENGIQVASQPHLRRAGPFAADYKLIKSFFCCYHYAVREMAAVVLLLISAAILR